MSLQPWARARLQRWTRLTDRAVTGGYRVGWALLRVLPEPLVTAAFQGVADLAWRRRGRGVRRLEDNLRQVVGSDPQRLRVVTREALRSYARYWLEVFRLPVTDCGRLLARTYVLDEHRLRRAHARGRGVILALPHMGNWDQAGAWVIRAGIPFTTVVERLEPASLFDRFVAFRESLGMEVLPMTGGERPPFHVLADRLRAGRMLCLLADRDLSSRGIDVDFFGATARMPAGPALLALRTGAALLPVTMWYEGAAMGIQIHSEVQPGTGTDDDRVRRMTQAVADAFAETIAAHPTDWHMLQRVWVA